MNIYDLFSKGGDTSRGLKQAVIIHFNYGHQGLEPLHELESKLRILLFHEGTGELDGHEIAMDNADGSLYFYGPNAEALFKSVRPLLLKTPFMKKPWYTCASGRLTTPQFLILNLCWNKKTPKVHFGDFCICKSE